MAAGDTVDFQTATLNLYRLSGVAGVLLRKGGNQLANHMPFPDVRTLELGEQVGQMAAGYQTVNRQVRQVLVSYDAGALLVMMQADAQLVLLLTSRANLDAISNAASVFLKDHEMDLEGVSPDKRTPEFRDPNAPKEVVVTGSAVSSNGARLREEMRLPEFSRWPEVRKALEKVMAKVMGRAQVQSLISRVSAGALHGEAPRLSTEDAKNLARAVLGQVPNRSKRDALLSELEQAFQDSQL